MESELPGVSVTSLAEHSVKRSPCVLPPGAPRPFPPPGGLTFSCWFLISRQANVMEGHPLRFLTLVRHLARTEQPFVCFSISLCMDDLSLVVSTEEKEFQPLGKALGSTACVAHTWGIGLSPMLTWMYLETWKSPVALYLLQFLPWLSYLVKCLRNICSVPLWSGPCMALRRMLIGFPEY